MTVTVEDLRMNAPEPISLDELNAAAALLSRVDRKYALTLAAADAVVASLPNGTRALQIAGRRRFAYRSTYYDTPELTSFLDTARRRRRRFKVRTRTYVDSGERFLEVKTRRGGTTVKRRTRFAAAPELDAAALDFLTTALAEDDATLAGPLEPVLEVSYDRSTFLLPGAQCRVTVDRSIIWRDLRTGDTLTAPDLSIVETKSGNAPSAADRLLWRGGQRPVAVSKYATGLAALRADLPHNRWHRLLTSTPFAHL